MTTDFQLLDAWRGGDREAGNQLFRRHFDNLVRFFFSKIDDRDVEDLIQRTLLACVESRDRFRQQSSFRTYLFAVARNELLMFYRRRGRSKVDFANESVIDLGTSPSRAVVKAEEKALLLAGLRRLSVDQQMLLELHYWEGLQATDLAEVFEVEPTTARTRLHRARVELKKRLEQLADDPNQRDHALGGLDTWARELHLK